MGEVTSRLKSIALKAKSKIHELDATLHQLQKDSVTTGTSLSGEKICQKKIDPAPLKQTVMDTDVTQLTNLIQSEPICSSLIQFEPIRSNLIKFIPIRSILI